MKNTGTLVGATVRINDDLDAYPVALQYEIKGGHHSRSSVAEMEAMPVHLRDVGMTCYVSATGDTYELANDLTTWNLKNSTTQGGGTVDPGTGGSSSVVTIISGNFGVWTNIPSKSASIFNEQLSLQYKTDLAAFPTRAITYLTGQFGLNEAFANTEITLGILPLSSRPKAKLKKYMICKNIEMYLIIETTGHVKLLSKDGFNLPVCTETTENDPYFIDVFFNPNISDVEPETFSATRTEIFTRNNCGAGYTGGTASFSKTYTSTISQDDADNQAANDSTFNDAGQNFANNPANGSCTAIPENVEIRLVEVGFDPQMGPTNRFRFKITSNAPITENVTVNFSCNYDNVSGSGIDSYSGSITLPAGEIEFLDTENVLDTSPAGGIQGFSRTGGTPAPAATVIDDDTSEEKTIIYII